MSSAERASSPGFVPTEKLAEAVLRHLARDIVEGRLRPGRHLVETQLCEELGVSRSPLREAIHRLAAEGLVDIIPRKGAFVATLTERDINDVFAVRAQLERLAARLAAQRATAADVEELRRQNEQCVAAVEAGDVNAFFMANDAFHAQLARIASNDYLAQLQHAAAQRTYRPLFLYLSTTDHLDRSNQDHAALIEEIAAGHAGRAERLMADHLKSAEGEAVRALRNVP
jgi:DNA-binding GntR family transcriptional regulator